VQAVGIEGAAYLFPGLLMDTDSTVERGNFLLVLFGIALIERFTCGIGFTQRLCKIVDIAPGIGKILPGVRVNFAVMVVMLLRIRLQMRAFECFYAIAGDQHLAAIARRFDQTFDPALETKAIDDHQLGLGDGFGIGGSGLVDVSIGVLSDQVADLNTFAANALRDIAKNAEAGDDIQFSVAA